MNLDFALAYIPLRMGELGYTNGYMIKFRHLVLKAGESLDIKAYDQLYLLLDEPQEVTITSDFGLYDLLETNINEIIYEHQGLINIKNNSADLARIRFVQVIPKNYHHASNHRKN